MCAEVGLQASTTLETRSARWHGTITLSLVVASAALKPVNKLLERARRIDYQHLSWTNGQTRSSASLNPIRRRSQVEATGSGPTGVYKP